MAYGQGLIAITISRQLGAGGTIVGQRLAERLKLRYLDSNMLRLVAEKCGVSEQDLARWDEHRARFWEQLGQAFALGAPEGMWSTLSPSLGIYDRDVFELQQELVREIAARESCVVIGRAGFWILRDHPGLVSVFLHAAPAARLERVKAAFHVDDKHAQRMMDEIDADRSRFVRDVTGRELGAATQHLCIDTGRVSLETAEEMVVKLVEQMKCGGLKSER
jgi:cytidylate kinase